MEQCITSAIICTVSGAANAYFNLNKINEANENFNQMKFAYDKEKIKVDMDKTKLVSNINQLRDELQQDHPLSSSVSSTIKNTEQIIKNIQMTPKDIILKDVKARRFIPPRPRH